MPVFERTRDPLTGLVTETGVEDGKFHIRYTQQADERYRLNQLMREDDEYTKDGIKKSWMHAVSLTAADCLKMKIEDGLDPYSCTADELNRHVFRNRDKWGHCIVAKVKRI